MRGGRVRQRETGNGRRETGKEQINVTSYSNCGIIKSMNKVDNAIKIYERELQVQERVKKIANQSLSKDELRKELIELGKEYDKLLKNAIKITRIGDAIQKKLMRTYKLEQEKLQLEQIVKERTKEIQEKNQQLEEMAELKSLFFANISHEFRTPLTLIIGPLEQMLSYARSKEEKKKLTLMLRNSQRLLGLVNQLLELAKFESGKMKLQTSRQNIIPFLKGIVASFELMASEHELDLTFHAEEAIDLYFDPGKLEEVIYNLILNAIKFTPAGGKITITAARGRDKEANFPSGSLDITVADTGLGIPANRLDHIFDRFYQVEASYESKHKGSGIGLALVKELVEFHHGEIHVSSQCGENSGTKFIVRLPLGHAHLKNDEIVDLSEIPYTGKTHSEIRELYIAEKEEKDRVYGPGNDQKAAFKEGETAPKAPGKNIILVVEDSAAVRDYIRSALEPDYLVKEAKDGREGIKKAQELIPDLIISDIIMPGVDGYELCRVLKNDVKTSHIPIIILTAKASEENIIQGLETGADDYITKPFNTRILMVRIKNLIDIRSQLQQNLRREMSLQPIKTSVSKIDREFLNDLQAAIDKNISDPDFNVDQLCKKLYMGHTTLYRKIHALSGETPTEFIRSYRLKKGAELLKRNFGPVIEVAFEVGFSSAGYFTKCFKKMFHQLPTEYQTIESE
ncbi:MAG: response regulator [Candidatus Aminicenantes bacterium]|nr:MAG: response regulator [Candidatus Aminicenantes bacterium]